MTRLRMRVRATCWWCGGLTAWGVRYLNFWHWSHRLEEKGIGLHSLNEQIRTDSSTGKLVFHIFAALAEFERNLIRERTVAGLASARARGRKGGRREKLTQQQSHEIRVLMKDPAVKIANIARQYKVSRSTIYRVIANGDNTA